MSRDVLLVGGDRHGEVLTVRDDHDRLGITLPSVPVHTFREPDPYLMPRTVTMNIERIPLSRNRSVWYAAAPHLHADTARGFVADELHAAWMERLTEPNRRRTRIG